MSLLQGWCLLHTTCCMLLCVACCTLYAQLSSFELALLEPVTVSVPAEAETDLPTAGASAFVEYSPSSASPPLSRRCIQRLRARHLAYPFQQDINC